MYVNIQARLPEMLSIKRVRLVILAQKGILIVARVRWKKAKIYVCVEEHQECFLKIRRVRFAHKTQ